MHDLYIFQGHARSFLTFRGLVELHSMFSDLRDLMQRPRLTLGKYFFIPLRIALSEAGGGARIPMQ